MHTERKKWRGIHGFHLTTVKCCEPERNTTRGQDHRSARHNALIIGVNVWTPSSAPVPFSVEGNVKVHNAALAAGLSGNWNVSFLSMASQWSLDLVGTEPGWTTWKWRAFNGLFMWMCIYHEIINAKYCETSGKLMNKSHLTHVWATQSTRLLKGLSTMYAWKFKSLIVDQSL